MRYCDYLKTLTGCPFCIKEHRGILEKETAVLTYSLAPYHKHHLLVIPKRHSEDILDITEQERGEIDALQKAGLKLLRKLGYENMSLLVRQGKDSGKSVAHVHYHIIPDIRLGNIDYSGGERQVMSSEEIDQFFQEFQKALASTDI